jgi:hypothetical protein
MIAVSSSSWGRSRPAWVAGHEPGVVGFELGVAVFQFEYLGDAGEVDALGDEVGDPGQAGQVVLAVAAGPAVGAGGGEQSAPLIEPQGLRIKPRQL